MYILASKSPRRQELLKMLISDFAIEVSNIDESLINDEPYNLSATLSKVKAEEIFKKHPSDIIIAADTIVIHKNKVLGKPKNNLDAFTMLKELSDDVHDVITGFTILSKDKCITKSVITKVYFNDLSDDLINKYIQTGSPLDKAGAYGIQDKEFPLIKKIEGSYYNVMGLPVEELKKCL
ncbi:MAG: septum formation protein Maf [Erysipelotrichales bacterium]|nr:septum formation protein Maf [Erysipelotrichales bacterium]